MFNFIPFTRPGREMAHGDLESEAIGQPLQLTFPQPHPVAITPATISTDEQGACLGIQRLAHMDPPATDALDGETGGVVIAAYVDPSHVLANIIHAIGPGLSKLLVWKIREVDVPRVACFSPLLSRICNCSTPSKKLLTSSL